VRIWVIALVIVTACGRLGFGPIGGGDDVNTGNGDGGGSTTGDDGGGQGTSDAAVIPNCGSTVIIDDTFSDMSKGPEWTSVNTSIYFMIEAADMLVIDFGGAEPPNTRAGYRQTASNTFVGTCAIAEITAVPDGSPNAYAYLRLGTPTLNVELAVENGQVIGRFTNGGTSGQNGNAVYDAANHRFLRIRNSGGNYNFEVAPAITGPYQNLGLAGGAIVSSVSPSSLEIGGATTATTASSAGDVRFERVLFLGP
jgi:hypothetical protein